MAFVVTVFIWMQVCPVSEYVLPEKEEGCSAVYLGKTAGKEYRNGMLVLYLERAVKVPDASTQMDAADIRPLYEAVSEAWIKEKNSEPVGILCKMADGQEPELGSIVCVKGIAQNFSQARNPGSFDQKEYYRLQNLFFQLQEAELIAVDGKYSIYREYLYQMRRRMERTLERVMNEKDASIMKAMVLGNKAELDRDSKQLYQKSGIAHVLAISGLHISLLGMGLYRLLKKYRVPTGISVCIAVAVMLAYGDMVGMSSSAYRAIFMFAMKMGAEVLHRTYDMLTALALSAASVLLEQPLYLYHTGFLLSFGAILGVGCLTDVLETDTKQMLLYSNEQNRMIQKWRKIQFGIKESLKASLAIFLIHFPIMLHAYYEFPIYSFLLNLIVIPMMGVLMCLGLMSILCGSIPLYALQGIAQIAASGCHGLLRFFEGACNISLSLPAANWIIGKPAKWQILSFYLVPLLLWVLELNRRKQKECEICLPTQIKIMWIVAAVFVITHRSYNGLGITILDVGQGDGIWIETQTGHHYLIDSGSTSQRKLGEYTLLPFLKYTGTDKLEAVFLTHLDEDHISGVMELLENPQGIQVGRVVVAQAVIRDEAYDKLELLCKEKKIPISYASTGDVLRDGQLTLKVLHPAADYKTDSRNAYSLVMALEYGNFHALFTGDAGADAENLVAEELGDSWHCQLYKAAHHGSRYSNSQMLLETMKPELTVISCGEDNSYGHPHRETLERLQQVQSGVLITKDTGAIMLRITKNEVQAETFISSH